MVGGPEGDPPDARLRAVGLEYQTLPPAQITTRDTGGVLRLEAPGRRTLSYAGAGLARDLSATWQARGSVTGLEIRAPLAPSHAPSPSIPSSPPVSPSPPPVGHTSIHPILSSLVATGTHLVGESLCDRVCVALEGAAVAVQTHALHPSHARNLPESLLGELRAPAPHLSSEPMLLTDGHHSLPVPPPHVPAAQELPEGRARSAPDLGRIMTLDHVWVPQRGAPVHPDRLHGRPPWQRVPHPPHRDPGIRAGGGGRGGPLLADVGTLLVRLVLRVLVDAVRSQLALVAEGSPRIPARRGWTCGPPWLPASPPPSSPPPPSHASRRRTGRASRRA